MLVSQAHAAVTAIPASGDTSVAKISNMEGKTKLVFQFDVALQTLDAVKVYGKAHGGAQPVDMTPTWTALVATDRVKKAVRSTTSTGAIVDANIAVTTALQNGYFEMDIAGLAEVEVKVSSAVDGGSVTGRYSLS